MYRLVLAGDAGAGKSSFLLRLTNNQFKGDIQTTLGGWQCSHNQTHAHTHKSHLMRHRQHMLLLIADGNLFIYFCF